MIAGRPISVSASSASTRPLLDISPLALGLARRPLRLEARRARCFSSAGESRFALIAAISAACLSRSAFFRSEALASADLGVSRPILFIASRNSSRSSALSIASAVAPIICTPNLSSTPMLLSDSAQLSAVCPPMVGSSASGRSFSMILATMSGRDRLDIGGVGQIRIGHDRGRIGIDQHDPVALFLAAPCRPGCRNSRTRRPGR